MSIKSIQEGIIPPTINVSTIDPTIPKKLNIVTNTALETEVNVALSNTFGFGGHNAIVLFKKME